MTVTEAMINRIADNAERLGIIERALVDKLAHYGVKVTYESDDFRMPCKCTISCDKWEIVEYGILGSMLALITALEKIVGETK